MTDDHIPEWTGFEAVPEPTPRQQPAIRCGAPGSTLPRQRLKECHTEGMTYNANTPENLRPAAALYGSHATVTRPAGVPESGSSQLELTHLEEAVALLESACVHVNSRLAAIMPDAPPTNNPRGVHNECVRNPIVAQSPFARRLQEQANKVELLAYALEQLASRIDL